MANDTSSNHDMQNNGVSHSLGLYPPSSRQRITVALPFTLVERLRNAVYWTEQHTLAQIITDAIEDALAAMEQANGGPFPCRLAPLRAGRRPVRPRSSTQLSQNLDQERL